MSFPPADQNKTVQSVTFNQTAGKRLDIFALSGTSLAAAYPNELQVTANSTIDVRGDDSFFAALDLGNGATLHVTGGNSLTIGNVKITGGGSIRVATGETVTVGSVDSDGSSGTLYITGGGTVDVGDVGPGIHVAHLITRRLVALAIPPRTRSQGP